MKTEIEDEGYVGPLTFIFENSTAKVLDQSLIVGNMEQTISMLAESTNLSYKTVLTVIEKLEETGFMIATRKIGNAQAYRFEVTNDLHELIRCAQNLQIKRLNQEKQAEILRNRTKLLRKIINPREPRANARAV